MATHSSVLAWRIPGTGELGGLLSMGSHRVGHDGSDLAAVSSAKPTPLRIWDLWAVSKHLSVAGSVCFWTLCWTVYWDTDKNQRKKWAPDKQESQLGEGENPPIEGIRVLNCCCYSVTKSCPTLCSPGAWGTTGFPVLHYLLDFAQTCIHWISDAIQPFQSHLPASPPALNLFPASRSFAVSQLLASGGLSIGASASESVLPMNIWGWFPLGLIGWISLQSRGLSRVFSSTTVWKHQFFSAQPSLWSNSHIHTWLLEKP